MKTGIISKPGVVKTGFLTHAVKECTTLYKSKALETQTSGVNVESVSNHFFTNTILYVILFFRSENPELWFDKGCVHSFQNWIVKHLHVVGTIGLVIASIQLIGLLCSMLLFCSVKRRSKRSPESYKSYSPSSADLHSKNVSSWED